MVSRRTLLLGSAALATGAVAGCAGGPAPGSAPATTATSPSPTSPSPTSPTSPPSASSSAATTSPGASTSAGSTPSTAPSQAGGAPDPRITGTVAEDLDVPWGIVFLRSGDALVGERNRARLLRVTPSGKVSTVGDVAGVATPGGSGEGGLLGLALAPGDEDTLFAYITTGSDNRVVRLSLAGGRTGKPRTVLPGIPTSNHHHGGRLLFDTEGMLFVSTGDAEQSDLAQRRGSLAGKILRIRPDGRAAPGNPFGNATFSYGHRNIEGLAFDARGRLWATEFGDKRSDELNLIRRGGNYGWPRVEGRSSSSAYVSPRATWSPTSSCSPSGLAITRGTAFVGALQGRCLFTVRLDGDTAATPRAHFAGAHGRIRSVVTAPDGAVWMTTSNTDGRVNPGRHDDKILRVALG